MGGVDIEAFLMDVAGHVAASTRTQVICVILLSYKHVLQIDLPHLMQRT